MEVARRLWFRHLLPAWVAFAAGVGSFLEEAAFRLVLAFDVLAGRVPQQVEKRWWNRAIERPILVDVFDWTDDRLLFSVLVWPPLESPPESVGDDRRERTEQVLDAIARGASEQMWSTRWELDFALRWDHKRECWVASDDHAYDGSRFEAMRGRA